jgi:GT2 family glycosyltransferase
MTAHASRSSLPTYNRLRLLQRCTAALRRQDLQAPYEIVIADDGSGDGAVEFGTALAREEPRVRWVRGRHAGTSAAKNRGIRAARGDLLAFIDDDWIVERDFARRAVAFFDAHPERRAMTARMMAPSTSPFVERVNHLHYETDMRLLLERRNTLGHHLRNFVAGKHYTFRPQEAPYISASGGLVLRRAVLDLVGAFDEQLSIGEDTDLAWRMRARGITLFYNPTIEIVHHYRSTLRASLEQQFRYGIGLRDFVRRVPTTSPCCPGRHERRCASPLNLVLRPLKKALQTDSNRTAASLPAAAVPPERGVHSGRVLRDVAPPRQYSRPTNRVTVSSSASSSIPAASASTATRLSGQHSPGSSSSR